MVRKSTIGERLYLTIPPSLRTKFEKVYGLAKERSEQKGYLLPRSALLRRALLRGLEAIEREEIGA